jgi:hypothetical protein
LDHQGVENLEERERERTRYAWREMEKHWHHAYILCLLTSKIKPKLIFDDLATTWALGNVEPKVPKNDKKDEAQVIYIRLVPCEGWDLRPPKVFILKRLTLYTRASRIGPASKLGRKQKP